MLEMHADAIKPGQRVLIHDDLLATGGTAKAKIQLVEEAGGVVAGLAFIIELTELHGRETLCRATTSSACSTIRSSQPV